MTNEKMTIHRALVDLKTIDDRISKQIQATTFCVAAKHGSKKIAGISVRDFLNAASSSVDKICDLINRRNAIKAAVSKSNAETKIKIGDKDYTVAEAIAMKQYGMSLWESLRNNMQMQYATAVNKVEHNNSALDDKADRFVTDTYGGKDTTKDVDPEVIAAARAAYIESRQFDLFDGLEDSNGRFKSVKDAIEKLDAMICEFNNEVDAALSVSNATTTIEISY